MADNLLVYLNSDIPFNLLLGDSPSEEDKSKINIFDISNTLSKICRFGGRTKEFYSVAQHSSFVSEIAYTLAKDHFYSSDGKEPIIHREPTSHQERAILVSKLLGLLHDCAEAFTGDIIKPLKQTIKVHYSSSMHSIEDIEKNILNALYSIYGISPLIESFSNYDIASIELIVRQADVLALYWEAIQLTGTKGTSWVKPLDAIDFWGSHPKVKDVFEVERLGSMQTNAYKFRSKFYSLLDSLAI
jgi:5'-deoxynucleotidase YfbR-like HD superfamily hydrolase